VLGANRRRRKGSEAGQTLAEARAICPRLLSREASPERERAAAQAAREAASAVSPRVEEAGPGLVYLDVSGLESLIGAIARVARAVVAAAERVGVRAAVGLARASRWPGSPRGRRPRISRWKRPPSGVGGGAFRVVPAEEQREFLAALPLYAPGAARRSCRNRCGASACHARRGGGPAARTARGAAGAGGCAALAAGRRGGPSALAARPEPSLLEEGEELEWDASSVEPLLFVWKGLLDRLAQRCRRAG